MVDDDMEESWCWGQMDWSRTRLPREPVWNGARRNKTYDRAAVITDTGTSRKRKMRKLATTSSD